MSYSTLLLPHLFQSLRWGSSSRWSIWRCGSGTWPCWSARSLRIRSPSPGTWRTAGSSRAPSTAWRNGAPRGGWPSGTSAWTTTVSTSVRCPTGAAASRRWLWKVTVKAGVCVRTMLKEYERDLSNTDSGKRPVTALGFSVPWTSFNVPASQEPLSGSCRGKWTSWREKTLHSVLRWRRRRWTSTGTEREWNCERRTRPFSNHLVELISWCSSTLILKIRDWSCSSWAGPKPRLSSEWKVINSGHNGISKAARHGNFMSVFGPH